MNNVLDGTLSVIDTDDLVVTHTVDLTDIPLPETILQGKKIFNWENFQNVIMVTNAQGLNKISTRIYQIIQVDT